MSHPTPHIAIIGGGPAGLAAAESLSQRGFSVSLFDAMPSLGRKFLMAGRGGLNLTHNENFDLFCQRYGSQSTRFLPWLERSPPLALREWAQSLGVSTFVGSSGRVFPKEMKAAPLLRAWLHRLRSQGVHIHVRHRWQGWTPAGDLLFSTPSGERTIRPQATLLAVGGGSWAKLGSDGMWLPLLQSRNIQLAPLRAANCGFALSWSQHFSSRFAGSPLKNIAAIFVSASGKAQRQLGECIVTKSGIEGGAVYALSSALRDDIEQKGEATLFLDLLPNKSTADVARAISHPRGARSFSSHLQSRLGLHGVKAGLLREALFGAELNDPEKVAETLKALPLRLTATSPIDEAISTAGGVAFESLDNNLMLSAMPGVFCAGEMLDWEAPTGGYLLTGCIATGHAAANGIAAWLAAQA